MLPVRPKQTLSLQTRNRIRLDADVYYPDAEGSFPVLLMRQPYGRAIASTVVYAHPTWYAAHGYIVVIQDVRGRGTSEGEFRLFAHEVEDGVETVNWAASLPSSTGEVGMYGFSYQGMTQLYAAAGQPPALKTLCPAMIGYDLYADWAYEGGAFCLAANLGWATQLAAETARRHGDLEAYRTLYAAARSGPNCDPVSAQSSLLNRLAPDSFYHDWLRHPAPDDYWASLSPAPALQSVDLPMLHIGGWFDTYLRGTWRFYHDRTAHSAQPQHLWVGPWAHIPWGRRVGDVDFGAAAHSPIDRVQIRWFDQFLKGRETGLLDAPPVHLFEMGANQWRSLPSLPSLPSPEPLVMYLVSQGLASLGDRASILAEKPDPAPAPPDCLVHDPWRPVPALGGHAAMPAGMCDRAALDDRADVLTYTSVPLSAPLSLLGTMTLEVYCQSTTPSFDLCAVLSEVRPDGTAYHLTQGYRRVSQSDWLDAPLCLTFQPTFVRISSGCALRLSLSGACYPAYTVNAGTYPWMFQGHIIEAQVITVQVHSGGEQPSRLLLPVAATDDFYRV
ncbi:MAG: CocE/NonD family hydrolase [Synechococcales bacterium]|nr:CocE/NonD family hydrolase [Synechococcales bacterium]